MKFREHDFLRNMQSFLGGRLVLAFTTLLIGVITARLLTPENRGLYALFFTICGLLVTLLHVGISPANVYYLNEKKREISELLGNTLVYSVISLLVLTITFTLFINFDLRGPFTNIDSQVIWMMALVVVFFTLVETSVSGLAYASDLYSFISRALIFQSMLLLLSVSAVFFIGEDLVYVLFYRVIAVSIYTIYFMYKFKRLVIFDGVKFSYSTLKAQIKFGSKNWLQNIIGFLNVRCYILILGFTSNPKVIGFFSVAWLFTEIIRFLPDTIGTMLLPSLTSKNSDTERTLFTIRALKLIFYSTSLIALFLLLSFGFSIPVIFGTNYVASIDIARILILGATFGCIYQVLTRHFTSLAQQKYSLIAAFCGLLVGATGCVILADLYGGVGAAIAFGLGSLVTATVSLYFFCASTHTPFTEIFKINREDFSLT